MPRYLFDTDHLTLFGNGHPFVKQRYAAEPADTVGVSAVTVEEALRGRLAPLSRHGSGQLGIQAYTGLVQTVELLNTFPIVPFDLASDREFQQLRVALRRLGTQDLKIGAVALVKNLILLTRNRRDFGQIPGIVLDDWSV